MSVKNCTILTKGATSIKGAAAQAGEAHNIMLVTITLIFMPVPNLYGAELSAYWKNNSPAYQRFIEGSRTFAVRQAFYSCEDALRCDLRHGVLVIRKGSNPRVSRHFVPYASLVWVVRDKSFGMRMDAASEWGRSGANRKQKRLAIIGLIRCELQADVIPGTYQVSNMGKPGLGRRTGLFRQL